MLRPGSSVEHGLGDAGHAYVRLVQQHAADGLGYVAAAGLPAVHHLEAEALQGVSEQADLRGLAAAVHALHGQEGPLGRRFAGAEGVDEGLYGGGVHVASGLAQLLLAAVAEARADGFHAHGAPALDVEAAVAHHPGLGVVLRQRGADELRLVRAPGGAVRANDPIEEPVQAEVADDPLGGLLRLARGHAQPAALTLQRPQQAANAGIHPVLEQAHGGIPLPVGIHGPLCHVLIHAHKVVEGIEQRRADELPEGRRVRLREAQLLRRVAHAVPDALLGLGQRTVQIKDHTFVVTHSTLSPSTPNRC